MTAFPVPTPAATRPRTSRRGRFYPSEPIRRESGSATGSGDQRDARMGEHEHWDIVSGVGPAPIW